MTYKRFFLLLAVCLPMTLQATIQTTELIYVDGQPSPVKLLTGPLGQLDSLRYAELQRRVDSCNTSWVGGTQVNIISTGLYRGYRATWSLHNDSLRLIEVMNIAGAGNPQSKDARRVPTDGIVRTDGFADWFTGELHICMGEVLNINYLLDDVQYEIEWICTIKKGVMTACRKYPLRDCRTWSKIRKKAGNTTYPYCMIRKKCLFLYII